MKRVVLKKFLSIISTVFSVVRLFVCVLIKLLLQNETYLILYKYRQSHFFSVVVRNSFSNVIKCRHRLPGNT